MRSFNLLVSGFSAAVFVASGVAGCTFSPHPAMGTGGSEGFGTGGAMAIYPDASVSVPDAPREYVNAGDGNTEGGPTADANCGNQPFVVIAPPPDLLIVLDRSGSMNQDSMGMTCRGQAGCGATSKWAQMTLAINQVVAMTETSINWGLKFFGNDDACGVTAGAAVPPGPSNAAAIAAAIAAGPNQPGSSTPTRAGEMSAGEYLATLTDTNPKFILLATDGQPNCIPGSPAAMGDDAATIDSVAAVKTLGFPTFVIGIATGGSTADGTLNSMAVNGGFPRAGAAQQYYSVTTTADLVGALAAIQTITTGMCTYPLGAPGDSADIANTTVTVDGLRSTKDDPDGWHFDPGMRSITFTGRTCDQLMTGTLKNVQVLYGCKIVVL